MCPWCAQSALIVAWAMTSIASAAEAADTSSLRLDYRLPESLAGACPSASSFRDLVVARLGYDPFTTPSPDRAAQGEMRVVFTAHDRRVQVEALLARPGRPLPAPRVLEGSERECDSLVAAIATTLAIALDPDVETRGPASVPPPPSPRVPPPAQPPPAPLPQSPPPVRVPISLFATLAPVVSIGLAPSASLGGEVGAGLRRGRFSIEGLVRAEGTPSSSSVSSRVRLGATVFEGAAVPCGDIASARLCAVLHVGVLNGFDPDLPANRVNNGSVYVSLGPRAGYAFRLSSAVSLEPSVEADFSLVRTKLVVDSGVAWVQSVVAGSAAVTLSVAF